MQKKVIFLDRDGVINHDFGYVSKIEKFEFIDGVFDSCRYFLSLGYEIIVVTNQSGIGRAYYTNDDFLELTKYMSEEFEKEGVDILKVYHCPHAPFENCDCRKPAIGMILQSLNDFNIDLEKSWLIGDKISDIQTAINAKIGNKILISDNLEKSDEYFVAKSLFETMKIIKQ